MIVNYGVRDYLEDYWQKRQEWHLCRRKIYAN